MKIYHLNAYLILAAFFDLILAKKPSLDMTRVVHGTFF